MKQILLTCTLIIIAVCIISIIRVGFNIFPIIIIFLQCIQLTFILAGIYSTKPTVKDDGTFIYLIACHLKEDKDSVFTRYGWGNGYVALPKGHKYHGVHYDDIPVNAHGGLTYSNLEDDYWVVGFDTCHLGDDKESCPKSYVLQRTLELQRDLNL